MKGTLKFKIFNSFIVVLVLIILTQLSISTISAVIGIESVVSATSAVEETATEPIAEATTEAVTVEQTTAEPTTVSETTTAKAVTTTEPVAEQEIYTDSNEPENIGSFNNDEVIMLCKVTYGEAGNLSKTQQAAVVWCILNRVDSVAYPNTIAKVITQKSQFYGYRESNPINETTKSVVLDVLNRWVREKRGEDNVGRVLPIEYMYFTGNGKENVFRLSSKASSQAWDWSLPSPYGD